MNEKPKRVAATAGFGCQCRGWTWQRQQHGFTLVELVMVIVMLGVLAVFAAPRMFNSADFYARGLHDETLSLLRYAQKAAVAQRRMVCVTFDTSSTLNTAALTLENPTPVASPMPDVNCSVNLVGPKGDAPATVTARSGTGFSAIKTGTASVTGLIFNALGQPVSAARGVLADSSSVEITNASSITIEAVTGYVHD